MPHLLLIVTLLRHQLLFDVPHSLAHPDIRAEAGLVAGLLSWPGALKKIVSQLIPMCLQRQQTKTKGHAVTPVGLFALAAGHFSHAYDGRWRPTQFLERICAFASHLRSIPSSAIPTVKVETKSEHLLSCKGVLRMVVLYWWLLITENNLNLSCLEKYSVT